MKRRLRRRFRRWLECRTKRCDYFTHYLAYGPADLTHEGFHAAERKCEQVQQRYCAWLDAHPDPKERIPEYLDRDAAFWEKQVRA